MRLPIEIRAPRRIRYSALMSYPPWQARKQGRAALGVLGVDVGPRLDEQGHEVHVGRQAGHVLMGYRGLVQGLGWGVLLAPVFSARHQRMRSLWGVV